jgi:putative peptidoglycan lipid II flippase
MTKKNAQGKLFKNTGIMSIAVFFSRILGLVRDQVMAAFFGAGYVNDAFNFANNIPNLLRRLFGEGALSAAFVPIYNEYGIKRGKRYQYLFALNVLTILTSILSALTILGLIFAPVLVKIIYPGLNLETNALTVKLTYVLFPYLFFIGLSSTMIAILNSHNYFFITGLSSALLNIAWIALIFIGAHFSVDKVTLAYFAAFGVVLGGFLQTAINLPFLKKIGYPFLLVFKLKSQALKTLWKRFIPGMVGLGIREINLIIDAQMTSFLPVGSMTALGFGNRLMQLPLGVFGISAGTAVLPAFSRSIINKDWKELSDTLRFSMLFMLYIMLPITALITAGSYDFVTLLFKRGAFDEQATYMTVQALFAYSLGLTFFGLNQTITPVFYAAKDTKTPVKIAAAMCASNVVLNFILMFPLKHAGLALSTSICSGLQFVVVLRILLKRFPDIRISGMKNNLIKIISISAILFVSVYSISKLWIIHGLVNYLIKSAVLISVWALLFAVLGFVFKLEYWSDFSNKICKKLMKK